MPNHVARNHRRRLRAARRGRRRRPKAPCARRWTRRSICSTAAPRGWRKRRRTAPGRSISGSRRRCCCRSGSTTWASSRAVPARGVVGQGPVEIRRLGRTALPRRRVSRGAGLRRAPLRLHRARRGADAVIRQSRRLCRSRHHDRHLGDGRLLRADRQELPHFRRRRHRRRARAAAGGPGDHRGQLLHRCALGSGRGRDRARRRRAVDGRLHRRLDQDRRPRQRRDFRGRGAVLRRRGVREACPASRARTAKRAQASLAP